MDRLVLLERAYLLLLQMPHNRTRALNQRVYAELRDAIAEESGLPAETVQNNFEALALSQMDLTQRASD